MRLRKALIALLKQALTKGIKMEKLNFKDVEEFLENLLDEVRKAHVGEEVEDDQEDDDIEFININLDILFKRTESQGDANAKLSARIDTLEWEYKANYIRLENRIHGIEEKLRGLAG